MPYRRWPAVRCGLPTVSPSHPRARAQPPPLFMLLLFLRLAPVVADRRLGVVAAAAAAARPFDQGLDCLVTCGELGSGLHLQVGRLQLRLQPLDLSFRPPPAPFRPRRELLCLGSVFARGDRSGHRL